MEIEELVKRVNAALMAKGYTIATAEECTCGLIGASIGSEDYAQKWYKGTVTAYTEDAVTRGLDVPQHIIAKNDLVSCQVAQQMALNVLYKFNTEISVGVVGYVDGYGSSDVDAGTVQICIAKLSYESAVSFKYKRLQLTSSERGKNIEFIIQEVLIALLEHIMGD